MPPPAASARYPSPSQPSGKSEVTDLKSQLRQLAGSRAPGVDDSKRDLFKKVISYMTIGIDVSSVFGEMVMCSATSDIVLKKMCYLYVGNYAKGNPDLSLLTINFLQRDCKDEDPMIRGLALRSLCSLRVPNLVEYLLGPLGSGLKDNNSYVRTIAVTGVLKLYHISASTCIDAEFPATLKSLMLHDSDAQVVANCLAALQEIWSLEASHSEEACREKESLLSKPLIYYFLNRIKEFNEWAQCLILELAVKYVPSDSNDIFDIMNLLEDRLQHANGAVVLATVKVFLQLTLSMTDVHQQVYERIKSPLLTLVSSGSPEQSYAILSHLHLLVVRAPFIFASDYKHFYCQYNEPSYVKKLKLEMLTAIANESNTYEIVTELCEYAANVDIEIARESIRAVGKIALQQYDVNAIVDRLLQFLEMEKDYVTAETLVLVKDLLRKHPQWSHDCISVVGGISSKNIQEPKAKAALIWMLGEYAQDMSDAPYILENLIENWEEEHSAEVRLHLLTAAMKCFFKRAPETQKALGIALAAGIADFHQDVHDRALFYYRVLQYDVHVAERVVSPPQQAVSAFADTQSSEIKDRIFDEFNSLSVIYQKPSYMFTDKEHRGPFEFSDELGNIPITPEASSEIVPAQQYEANDKDLLLSTDEKDDNKGLSSNNGSAYTAPYESSNISSQMQELAISGPAASATTTQSSFDFDDLLGLGLSTAPVPTPSPPLLKLNPRASLDPRAFQQKWRQLPISLSQEYSVNPQGIAALTVPQSLIKHMQSHSIHCIASGGQAPNFKFFFFAQKEAEPSDYLTECIINSSTAKAQIKVKADEQSTSQAFATVFETALSKFGKRGGEREGETLDSVCSVSLESKAMVFYFKARPDAGDYTIFMGLDKFENEELIKYGFPEDVWFHVDKMSSAHVYLRLHKGQGFDNINEGVLEDCAQLVKANSIQGNKVNNVDVVYTPWSNLKKTASMDVGQVGFHNSKMVRTIRVEKRVNDIVNRLNKTKVERTPDLRAEREAVNAAERAERKQHLREKKKREEIERLEKERQAEMRSYKGLMVTDKMTSNKDIASSNKSLQELEDDFM